MKTLDSIKLLMVHVFSRSFLKSPRDSLRKFILEYVDFMKYNHPLKSSTMELITRLRKEVHLLMKTDEAYILFSAAKRARKIEGDYAEVGVYKGATAKLISEAKGDKKLHLFDTFEGLPEVNEQDDPYFQKGQYKGTLDEVQRLLANYENLHYYKGFFPETGKDIAYKRFAFVHLDVDTYKSTKSSLGFFYPRMNTGGILISHDFITAQGVTRAFEEFFKDKPEVVIEMAGMQCLVVKCA